MSASVALEGFHCVKHALRFAPELVVVDSALRDVFGQALGAAEPVPVNVVLPFATVGAPRKGPPGLTIQARLPVAAMAAARCAVHAVAAGVSLESKYGAISRAWRSSSRMRRASPGSMVRRV